MILGGSAFAVSALTASISKSRLEDIPGIRNDTTDLDGVYLGAGRSMWFLYTRNAEKLAGVLDAHPDHGQTMARGLGIAITLTQLDQPERILPEIAALAERLLDRAAGRRLHGVHLPADGRRARGRPAGQVPGAARRADRQYPCQPARV